MKFAFSKTHPLCEPVWLLEIDNWEELMVWHGKISRHLFQKYGLDPHLWKDGQPSSEAGRFMDPIKFGAMWLGTATQMLAQFGRVFMNRVGGLCPRPEVIKQCTAPNWPDASPIAGEMVFISKWAGGHHYYLRSSKDRVLPFEKTDTLAEAEAIAAKFAPGCEISYLKESGSFPAISGD